MLFGKIYRLTPHKCDEFYIGSSVNIQKRERTHISDSKNNTSNVYKKIRECGGFEIEVLYEYECETEKELRMEEQRAIYKLNPTLNTNRAYRSEEQNKDEAKQHYEQNKEQIIIQQNLWKQNNKDKTKVHNKTYKIKHKDIISEKAKVYYENNKERINEYTKKYQQENKDKLREKNKIYNEANRDKIAQKRKVYYENNRDKIRAYAEENKDKAKAYREANRDKLAEQSKRRINCECGNSCLLKELKKHQETKLHLRRMEELNLYGRHLTPLERRRCSKTAQKLLLVSV